MTCAGLCLEFADSSHDASDELWQRIDSMTDGKEKDLLLMHILKNAKNEEVCFCVFFATPNESLQDLALMNILAMTHSLTVAQKVQKYGSECVQKFADMKFDLLSFKELNVSNITNTIRLSIARASHSLECRRFALTEVLLHNPTFSEALSVYNHPDSTRLLIREAEVFMTCVTRDL